MAYESEVQNMIRSVKDAFPAPEFRRYQEEMIEEMCKGFADGNDHVVLNSPVGSGKSLVNSAFAFASGSTVYATPQVSLVDQIDNDDFLNGKFPDRTYVALYGRNNYQCQVSRDHDSIELLSGDEKDISAVSAEMAPSRRFSEFDYEEYGPCCNPDKVNEQNYHDACPYAQTVYDAKQALNNGGNVVTSFSYYLLAPHFDNIDLLILDECHNIEAEGLRQSDIYITENTLPFWDELQPPETMSPQKNIDWLTGPVLRKVERHIRELDEQSQKDAEEIRMLDKLKSVRGNITMVDDMRLDFVIEETERVDGRIFKPLQVTRMFKDKVFGKANKTILSSATMMRSKLSNIGLYTAKGTKYIESQHLIDKDQRPIKVRPVANLSYDTDVNGIPKKEKKKVVEEVRSIMEDHSDEKGVVHCRSYSFKDYLTTQLGGDTDRIMTHNSSNRERKLEEFKNTPGNPVLFSVAMEEGINLEYDDARFNIIAKIPFKNTQDKRVKRRMEQNSDQYFNQAMEQIIQAYGRTTRSPDDRSVTYILDARFEKLFDETRTFCPFWFEQAIMWDDE